MLRKARFSGLGEFFPPYKGAIPAPAGKSFQADRHEPGRYTGGGIGIDKAVRAYPVEQSAKAPKPEAAPHKRRKGRKAASASPRRPCRARLASGRQSKRRREGKLPEPQDFSAETHKRFRNKLQSVVDLAKVGDLKDLRVFEINPVVGLELKELFPGATVEQIRAKTGCDFKVALKA